MSQQQMHDYVTAQLQKGFSPDQIKQNLIANGWPAQEIDSYFLSLSSPSSAPATPAAAPAAPKNYKKLIISGIVIFVLVAGGVAFFLTQNRSAKNQTADSKTSTQTLSPVPADTTTPPQETAVQPVEATFEENLSTCTPYKDTFKHPLTGETMEREIAGEVDGKCQYVEQMPNGGMMQCNYTEYERRAVAQYYIDLAAAESVGTSVNSNGSETTAEYTIDGKVVENPLAEAMENGTCVISGY